MKNEQFILYIDEAQRLSNPGLLLKAIIDLKKPIKLIASGSSQLEMKAKIQEHLTGRQFESLVLPLSFKEMKKSRLIESSVISGCYPQVVYSEKKSLILQQLYRDYITKDIIDFLKIGKSDVIEKLITLIAHACGQLVNYSQLATDCRVDQKTILHYLDILEKTYVIKKITPFIGNKRTEITTNPIYYFLDNGFRNQGLNNFHSLEERTDNGLLIQASVFQELFKIKTQTFSNFTIHFWRTKNGAEVDFVLCLKPKHCIPLEVKYRNLNTFRISRAYRSFLQAYTPTIGIYITKNWNGVKNFEGCEVHFIAFDKIETKLYPLLIR